MAMKPRRQAVPFVFPIFLFHFFLKSQGHIPHTVAFENWVSSGFRGEYISCGWVCSLNDWVSSIFRLDEVERMKHWKLDFPYFVAIWTELASEDDFQAVVDWNNWVSEDMRQDSEFIFSYILYQIFRFDDGENHLFLNRMCRFVDSLGT